MNENNYQQLEISFQHYVNEFRQADDTLDENLFLKLKHTYKVVENIKQLAKALFLSKNQQATAKAAALFHDIGRFEQFSRYKTFSDPQSVNHAQLGKDIVQNRNFLAEINGNEKNAIILAIENHNKLFIDKNIKGFKLELCKMLRDADKIDIYRVVTDYYNAGNYNPALEYNLPRSGNPSNEVLNNLLQGKIISKNSLKNTADFKLLQLSWIYDLYYKQSLKIIYEKNFLPVIINQLSNVSVKEKIQNKLDLDIKKKLVKN